MIVRKEILAPGVYHTPEGPVEFTADDVRAMFRQGRRMLSTGLQIPVPLEHQDVGAVDQATRMANTVLHNAGWVKDYVLDDAGTLHADLEVLDPRVQDKLDTTVRYVSPQIHPVFVDGAGRRWTKVVTHVALTPRPVWATQKPFGSDGASLLSQARPLRLSSLGGRPLRLSALDRLDFEPPPAVDRVEELLRGQVDARAWELSLQAGGEPESYDLLGELLGPAWRFGWQAAPTRKGGTKAVGNAEHAGKVLYGEQARRALNPGAARGKPAAAGQGAGRKGQPGAGQQGGGQAAPRQAGPAWLKGRTLKPGLSVDPEVPAQQVYDQKAKQWRAPADDDFEPAGGGQPPEPGVEGSSTQGGQPPQPGVEGPSTQGQGPPQPAPVARAAVDALGPEVAQAVAKWSSKPHELTALDRQYVNRSLGQLRKRYGGDDGLKARVAKQIQQDAAKLAKGAVGKAGQQVVRRLRVAGHMLEQLGVRNPDSATVAELAKQPVPESRVEDPSTRRPAEAVEQPATAPAASGAAPKPLGPEDQAYARKSLAALRSKHGGDVEAVKQRITRQRAADRATLQNARKGYEYRQVKRRLNVADHMLAELDKPAEAAKPKAAKKKASPQAAHRARKSGAEATGPKSAQAKYRAAKTKKAAEAATVSAPEIDPRVAKLLGGDEGKAAWWRGKVESRAKAEGVDFAEAQRREVAARNRATRRTVEAGKQEAAKDEARPRGPRPEPAAAKSAATPRPSAPPWGEDATPADVGAALRGVKSPADVDGLVNAAAKKFGSDAKAWRAVRDAVLPAEARKALFNPQEIRSAVAAHLKQNAGKQDLGREAAGFDPAVLAEERAKSREELAAKRREGGGEIAPGAREQKADAEAARERVRAARLRRKKDQARARAVRPALAATSPRPPAKRELPKGPFTGNLSPGSGAFAREELRRRRARDEGRQTIAEGEREAKTAREESELAERREAARAKLRAKDEAAKKARKKRPWGGTLGKLREVAEGAKVDAKAKGRREGRKRGARLSHAARVEDFLIDDVLGVPAGGRVFHAAAGNVPEPWEGVLA